MRVKQNRKAPEGRQRVAKSQRRSVAPPGLRVSFLDGIRGLTTPARVLRALRAQERLGVLRASSLMLIAEGGMNMTLGSTRPSGPQQP